MGKAEGLAELRALPPPREVYTLWVETNEAAVAFIEAVILWQDHIANVRREFRKIEGHTWFKMFVTSGCLGEVLRILERLRRFVYIGSVRVEAP